VSGPHASIGALAPPTQQRYQPEVASEIIGGRRLDACRHCAPQAENKLPEHLTQDRWTKVAARNRRVNRHRCREPGQLPLFKLDITGAPNRLDGPDGTSRDWAFGKLHKYGMRPIASRGRIRTRGASSIRQGRRPVGRRFSGGLPRPQRAAMLGLLDSDIPDLPMSSSWRMAVTIEFTGCAGSSVCSAVGLHSAD
jgi:hypothetical protein